MPTGFTLTQTPHFNIYAEGARPSHGFLDTLERLHSNLMIDLAIFSPWAREERVSLFLIRREATYNRFTGRPAGSGGVSSVSKRRIYLYESEELIGILAHELCHIFFNEFFVNSVANTLWLSEGLATMVEIERGLASPSWLREQLELLSRGGGYALEDLMRLEDTSGADDDTLRLWYAQTYSMVRFLIRARYASSFYHFCRHLRDGLPAHQALYRAYGMPFNRIKALEYVWRTDLQTRRKGAQRSARLAPEDKSNGARVRQGPPGDGIGDGHRLAEDAQEGTSRPKKGPSLYYLLLIALGAACAIMIQRLHADQNLVPIERVETLPLHRDTSAPYCRECRAKVDRLIETMSLNGPLSQDQLARLIEAADRCPIHTQRA